ncbi:hypothetical protein V2I01_42240 [Micromonospora sp. BRA006-A]|nr:hypothetical protein [Micromonospora sp. BRA006-A]
MTEGKRERANERFEKVAEETSETVTHAATVLEEELAAGLAGARRLEEKLTESRRVDPEAFDELVARVRTDGHALIDTVVGQLKMADDQRGEVIRRYVGRARRAGHRTQSGAAGPQVANGLADRLASPAPKRPADR